MTMTEQKELLERYLAAVGRYLPGESRNDTLAELRANLLAQMEDKAEALGRALTEEEEAEILRGHGHPSMVAARYRPRRQLIGPEIFPFYWLTMRRVLPFVVVIFVVSRALGMIYGPLQSHMIVPSILDLYRALFYFFGWLTLLFAAVEFFHVRYPEKVTLYADWDPRKLAKVESQEKSDLPRHPVADLIFSVLFTVWLLAFPHYPYLFFGRGASYLHEFLLSPAPVLYTFYWAAVALNCMQLVFKVIALFPSARRWRRAMKMVEKVGGLALLAILLRAHEYVIFTGHAIGPERMRIATMLNLPIHQALELVALIMVLKLLWDVKEMVMDVRHPAVVTASDR
jgi:hypothetical protein